MTDAGNLNTDFSGILNTTYIAATLSCSLVFLLLFITAPPPTPQVLRKRISGTDIYRESDVRHAHEKK